MLVSYEYGGGANFLSSTEPIKCTDISYNGMKVGDKVSQLGSKKRSSFKMKDGHFMQFKGRYALDDRQYLVFTANGEETQWKGLYWYYCFLIIRGSENLLYMQMTANSGAELVVDEIKYFN